MECLASFPEATATFSAITDDPSSLTLESLRIKRLERLTILIYSRNCSAHSVNEARKLMFTQGLKSLEFIPSTKNMHSVPGYVWSSPFSETRRSQTLVTGDGSGSHIGPIFPMSAGRVRCYCNVGMPCDAQHYNEEKTHQTPTFDSASYDIAVF